MRVTFPRMGHIHLPMRAIMERLGAEVIVPPPITGHTIALGARHSPEFACFPLKLNLGNFLEAAALGADTAIMGGGIGPCRFGYYAEVERRILADLGVDLTMVVLEPPRGHLKQLLGELKRVAPRHSFRDIWEALHLGLSMFAAIDALEEASLMARPVERRRGDTTRALAAALERLGQATTAKQVRKATLEGLEELRGVERDVGAGPPLRVGLVGEIYMVTEPAANQYLERQLGELGVEVVRGVAVGQWIRENIIMDVLRLRRGDRVKQAAKPYLGHPVGGEGLESVGRSVLFAADGLDGVIQVGPLTCMPEIVAQSILPRVSADTGLPIITLYFDEHSAEVGVATRLEAFVDLLRQRRRELLAVGGE